jgi:hypothetical protein
MQNDDYPSSVSHGEIPENQQDNTNTTRRNDSAFMELGNSTQICRDSPFLSETLSSSLEQEGSALPGLRAY